MATGKQTWRQVGDCWNLTHAVQQIDKVESVLPTSPLPRRCHSLRNRCDLWPHAKWRRTSHPAGGYLIDGVRNERMIVMPDLKIAAVTAAALLGSTMMVGTSAAMPLNGLPQASKDVASNVQDVRLVCGPRGCWHRPGWRGPGWHRWGWRGPGWNRWGWGGPGWGWGGPGWHRWGWRGPGWHRAGWWG
jgi:hypothetical protein